MNNSGENNLIFFVPKASFYSIDSLNDKTFFYSHIFKRSNYDPSLYVNFLGKVLKSKDQKKFVTELGFKNRFELNVKNTFKNEDMILSYTTDGICIDVGNKMDVVDTGEKNPEFQFKRLQSSKEYIEYYSSEELKNGEKYKKFIKGKANLDKFIYAMKNNNILMKENEDAYGTVFFNSVSKLINYFTIKDLYDDVMKKFNEFYKEEESQIKQKLKENTAKFSIDELKLPNSIANCKFSGVNKNLANLSSYRTRFEKKKFLTEIYDQIFKEANDTYKKMTGKNLDVQAEFMISFWIYILANSGFDHLIAEALFFETLQIQVEKGADEVIVNHFITAVKYIKDELLKNEKDINVFMVKPFVVTTEE